MMTLMGFSGYEVTHGKITFKGEDVTHMPIHERAQLGIGVMFQRPPTINGLKTRSLVQICGGDPSAMDVEAMARDLNLSDFLDRDVNHNFSGGEIKRSELLQLMAQQPDLVLLDEPESGVDLESIVLLGETINTLLGRGIRLPQNTPHKDVVARQKKIGPGDHPHRAYSGLHYGGQGARFSTTACCAVRETPGKFSSGFGNTATRSVFDARFRIRKRMWLRSRIRRRRRSTPTWTNWTGSMAMTPSGCSTWASMWQKRPGSAPLSRWTGPWCTAKATGRASTSWGSARRWSVSAALEQYLWKNVNPDTDRFTRQGKRTSPHEGYFIRSHAGVRAPEPVQACLYIAKDNFSQNVHNIVVAEENSELHIITGLRDFAPSGFGTSRGRPPSST